MVVFLIGHVHGRWNDVQFWNLAGEQKCGAFIPDRRTEEECLEGFLQLGTREHKHFYITPVAIVLNIDCIKPEIA